MRRLPHDHPKQKDIESSFAKHMAGFRGEESLDYSLSFLADKKCAILHDLLLSDGVYHFQLDTVIVTPHFLLVLEVKNITGTLVFDMDFNQLIRINEHAQEEDFYP
ncbi:nuclease-related domain-containing protein [Fictibacillus enclensis]|uniref:nuclease-related domain-containing protein n=1 Tax=Fictibacillus enclensis TaxID=1017270 RepID=UPI0024BF94C4|nr:nuclease-related domain-containing protein [Fictibacillus enclensis]WHY71334.1 nuclease-related domain-containing protein [Fictibacillus enclensis]